jgi:hypothetical protein
MALTVSLSPDPSVAANVMATLGFDAFAASLGVVDSARSGGEACTRICSLAGARTECDSANAPMRVMDCVDLARRARGIVIGERRKP